MTVEQGSRENKRITFIKAGRVFSLRTLLLGARFRASYPRSSKL